MKAPEVMARARRGSGILNLRFNQDQGCFTCCMDTGLRIYNVEPLVEKTHYNLEEIGDVIQCEMLYRSNLLFTVRRTNDNILRIYDDAKNKYIAEIDFTSSIKAIRVRKDKIAVALELSVFIIRWPSGSKAQQVLQTPLNPTGICELTALPSAPRRLLAAPGHKTGSVQLLDVGATAAVNVLRCHTGALRCIALSASGALLATASVRGTLLRVWCTRRKGLLHTLRRGADHATLFCMNFSRGGEMLCCCSDKGTLHVFQIGGGLCGGSGSSSSIGSLAAASEALLGGERPLASGAIPREQPALCAFVTNTSVAAICVDGTFHKYVFTGEGACHREAYDIFLQVGDDDDFIYT